MLTEYLVPLALTFALIAVAMLAAAIVGVRRVRAAAGGLRRMSIHLDDRAALLPIVLSTTRAGLAERGAATEQLLWTIKRFDDQVSAATAELARRREGVDKLRAQLEDSRVGIDRIKSAVRLIMRAIELRRTILG